MARSLVAAAVQLAAHSRTSFESAWPRLAARIEAAAASGARLIVLPEGTIPSYVLGYEALEPRETEAALRQCCALARQYEAVIVVGAARREGRRVFNSAIVIDADGAVAGSADKHFLWHFDRQWFAPGERISPVKTAIGTIGALVCADGRIPTIASTLVDRGAEVLVMPTAWVTSGRDPDNLENAQADLLARVRARENGVPFIGANKCGVELGCVAYCGKSQIVSAQGDILARASERAEETVFCEIELGAPKTRRSTPAHEANIATHEAAVRVALAARERRADDGETLRILEADLLISGTETEPGDAGLPYMEVDDEAVLDPAGLAALRTQGVRFAVWRTAYDPHWQVTFARARALELRMYVAVVDAAQGRAYAVDPDGTVVCGTFGEYEIASFLYDPLKTLQTAVAPGTDVLQGLTRAQTHAAR